MSNACNTDEKAITFQVPILISVHQVEGASYCNKNWRKTSAKPGFTFNTICVYLWIKKRPSEIPRRYDPRNDIMVSRIPTQECVGYNTAQIVPVSVILTSAGSPVRGMDLGRISHIYLCSSKKGSSAKQNKRFIKCWMNSFNY